MMAKNTSSTGRESTNLRRAITIRDAILAWLPGHIELQDQSGMPFKTAWVGNFNIFYRPAITKRPLRELILADASPELFQMDKAAADTAIHWLVGYDCGLDVWLNNKKMLSVQWDQNGSIKLVSFRGGVWDDELAKLLAPGAPSRGASLGTGATENTAGAGEDPHELH